MHVAELWRYPVKSMAGERVDETAILTSGIPGDRIVQIDNGHGRVATARTYPALLGHRATLADGEPLVDGRPWTDPAVLADVRRIVGPQAYLVRDEDPDGARFDILPLLVATDGAIAAFGRDLRRLRPNIVVGGVPGLDERNWPGRYLRLGRVEIRVDSLRGRCVMTTYDPDSLAHDPEVLRDIVNRFGGRLALNCDIVVSGTIAVGQAVAVIEPPVQAALSRHGAAGI